VFEIEAQHYTTASWETWHAVFGRVLLESGGIDVKK